MRIRRRGGLRLELGADEAAVLHSLLDQTAGIVRDPDEAGSDVLRRLVPDAYPDDPKASEEFREMTRDSAVDARLARLDACREEVGRLRDGAVDLSGEGASERWIQALNDVRLTLGTRLGVTADERRDVDPDDPAAQLWTLYQWLTAMQDMLVTAVMR